MAMTSRALSALGVALLLSGCATVPPTATSTSPSAVMSPTAASPSAESASPSPSDTDSPSPSAGTSTSPAAPAVLVLRPTGIDSLKFGAAEKDVVAVVDAKAGKPDDSYTGKVCELDDATPYGRQLLYGGAALLFQSKAKGTQSSPRTLTSWVVNLDQPLRSAMKLEAGYPTETTFAKLKTTFPKGKLSKIALGESAVWIFTTPSGLWYRGDDNKTPTDVGAGSMGTCE